MKAKPKQPEEFYLGVDVGGTKILAVLADQAGTVLARRRSPTPRDVPPEATVKAIQRVINDVLRDGGLPATRLRGIGIAVPGVVDPAAGNIVTTPNMNLSGVALGSLLQKKFHVPVFLENDVNLGVLGEAWLGAARGAESAIGIFVGTGIGGGIVIDGQLVTGYRNGAAEIGHMVVQVGGPLCGCGNRGCLEALASRTAIERDIREAIGNGRPSVVRKLTNDDQKVIRSNVLKKALKQDDPLVAEVLRKASETIGYACLTLRHVLDPEYIVLGGGVVEACGNFMLPIIEQIVNLHSMPGARENNPIVASKLGDDAVALGGVALVKTVQAADERARTGKGVPRENAVPVVHYDQSSGAFLVGEKPVEGSMYIRADGKIKTLKVKSDKKGARVTHALGVKELKKVCKKGPDRLFIGTRKNSRMALTEDGEAFLKERNVTVRILPCASAVKAYNGAVGHKSLLLLLG
jgi:glucokinase